MELWGLVKKVIIYFTGSICLSTLRLDSDCFLIIYFLICETYVDKYARISEIKKGKNILFVADEWVTL